MKFSKRFLCIVAIVALLCEAALAASPVGKWKGRMSIDFTKTLAQVPADQKAKAQVQLKRAQAEVTKVSFILTMKADRTYVIVVTDGTPPKSETHNGTWTQAGNQVTIFNAKDSHSKMAPQKLTLSPNGKKMTLINQNLTMTFTR